MRDVIAPLCHAKIDYIEAVDAADLTPVEVLKNSVLLAVAVRFGKARLIDNAPVRVKMIFCHINQVVVSIYVVTNKLKACIRT